MQPFKVKESKKLDIDSKLKEYIVKNYDANSVSERAKNYFSEISQNRSVISKMDPIQKNTDVLKQNINVLTHYINELYALKLKMTFGKEPYSCKLEFVWTDVLKNLHWNSFNIDFEIYNNLFNLACLYYSLGFFTGTSEGADKNLRKEASKYFKHAMYIFDIIKNEAPNKIIAKELPYDLCPTFLDYCISMCVTYGNIQILLIAKETSPKEFGLHAKLALGISESYKKAYTLSCLDPVKKSGEDNFRNFLLHKANYYKAVMFKYLRDGSKNKFDEGGLGYGEMLYNQGLYVEALIESEKNIKKCGKLINIELFQKELEDEKKRGAEFLDLNNRIYHQAVPKGDDITYESKDLMSGLIPDDLYINENEEKLLQNLEINSEDLDLLVPKQVKEMINRYKTKMNEIIQNNLNDCENEMTISEFINNLNLPERFVKKKNDEEEDFSKKMPPQLIEKIKKVQEIGGANTLSNIMNGIMNKSNFLIRSLEVVLNSFSNEDRDDAICRQRFGEEKWIRKPSSVLNVNYVQAVRQYIDNLNQTKQFDIKESNDIMDEMNYYDNIMLPMKEIVNRIPKGEEIKLDNSEEEEIKKQLNVLYELSDKCTVLIKKIFNELNDDSSLVPYFVEVLGSKTTEQAIFERNKEQYNNEFAELKKLSEEVNNQKNLTTNACQKIYAKLNEGSNMNINEDAMNYFRDLDQTANLFMNKYEKLKKGDNYYNNLNLKVDDLVKKCNEWMINRSDERNALVQTLSGKRGSYASYIQANRNYMLARASMDASNNPNANMNMNMCNNNNQGNQNQGGQNNQNQGNWNNQNNQNPGNWNNSQQGGNFGNQGYGNQGGF